MYEKINAAKEFQEKIIQFSEDNSKWNDLMAFIKHDMEKTGETEDIKNFILTS